VHCLVGHFSAAIQPWACHVSWRQTKPRLLLRKFTCTKTISNMEALRTFLLAEERPDRDPTLAIKGSGNHHE
jgi:hypothetical protein